ncbi:MAG TPA: protein-L-isoaspartate(D-aspartate) O-methyltransferase [Gemmatimonadota bacterium]|nr:protein-L-isoaspartate(D-aspartate) O-methyltransferase [Gemmatimonadota bacterium]
MVHRQVLGRGVTDPAVTAAMGSVPRHEFVPPEYIDLAYDDRPLPIGYGQTISQPYIVGYMTAALEVGPDDRVLEVGTGSGYQTAVLSEIVRLVFSVEIVPELARRAGRTLRELGYRNARVIAGDGHDGWPRAAPFQGIVLTAAPPAIPIAMFEQLAEGGRLVAPVGQGEEQRIVRWRYAPEGVRYEELIAVRFVPMTGGGPLER